MNPFVVIRRPTLLVVTAAAQCKLIIYECYVLPGVCSDGPAELWCCKDPTALKSLRTQILSTEETDWCLFSPARNRTECYRKQ